MTTDSPSPRTHPEKPPVPGDLFVLRATAGLPVEWALLERGSGGRFLAVPADAGPPAGTADVEVPAGSPGGPLSLRCRFSLWLDASLLDPELRSGTLAPEIVGEARFRIRQIESGNLEGSPLAEEIDVDSEYQDWIRDVPEQAVELAATVRPEKKKPSSRFPWYGARLLAATFAALSIGLSLWVGCSAEKCEPFQPDFGVVSAEIDLGDPSRGGCEPGGPTGSKARIAAFELIVDPVSEEREGFGSRSATPTSKLVYRSPNSI